MIFHEVKISIASVLCRWLLIPKEADFLKGLPFHHKDPFDRMLIAQGIVQNYPVLTDDPKFKPYDCRVL